METPEKERVEMCDNKKGKRRIPQYILALGAFVILIALVFGGFTVVNYLSYAKMRRVQPATIYIPSGSALSERVTAVVASGAVLDTTEFLNYMRRYEWGEPKPGKYVIKERMTYRQFLYYLANGLQTPVNIVLTPSRTIENAASKISLNIELDSTAVDNLFRSEEVAARYGYDTANFTAMLIPDTYEVYWNISADQLLDRFQKENAAFWAKDGREAKLAATGLTKNEAVNLAAIVSEESRVEEDQRKIAGVYLNRLKKGMKLQADPTCKYAAGDWTLTRVLYAHTRIESPYNTYYVTGLPPGPIVIPSAGAIDAVLNSEKSDNIFFCASPAFDGTHNFAKDLKGHNDNVQAFRKAYQERMAQQNK